MSGPDLWTITWVAAGLVFAYGWRTCCEEPGNALAQLPEQDEALGHF